MAASNLSDREFKKKMGIRMFREPSENYNGMKKDIEIIKRNQSKMKNTIPEMKTTLGRINSRLNEAEDQINDLED